MMEAMSVDGDDGLTGSSKAILDHERGSRKPLYHLLREAEIPDMQHASPATMLNIIWHRLSWILPYVPHRRCQGNHEHYITVDESDYSTRDVWRRHLATESPHWAEKPFEEEELLRGLPLRVRLARVRGKWRLLLLIHHIICDEYSLQQLLRWVARADCGYPLVRALSNQFPSSSSAIETNENDSGMGWSARRRQWLQLPEDAQLNNELVFQPPLSITSSTQSGHENDDPRSGECHFDLTPQQVAHLRRLTDGHQKKEKKKAHFTLFELLLTAFLMAWHRIDSFHAKRLLVGVPFVHGRHPGTLGASHVRTARLMVKVGSRCAAKRKMVLLLSKVAQQLRMLRSELHAPSAHDDQALPMPQVLFVSHRFADVARQIEGFVKAWKSPFCPFPLAVIISDRPQRALRISFEYRVSRFPEEGGVTALRECYEEVLQQFGPHCDLDFDPFHLPIIAPSQPFSSTTTIEYDLTIPHRFFRRAFERPQQRCLVEYDESAQDGIGAVWSYRRVADSVNLMRQQIRQIVKIHQPPIAPRAKLVPLLLSAMAEWPISFLAAASDGWCSVMVDVLREDPESLIKKLVTVRDDLAFAISTEQIFDRLEPYIRQHGLTSLPFVLISPPSPKRPIEMPQPQDAGLWLASCNPMCQPSDDLYGIFTSGSTGTPKLVLVNHGSAAHIFEQQIPLFGLTPNDLQVQFASPAFDASLSEMGTTWMAGATLLLCPHAPRDLGFSERVLKRTGATVVTLPPSFVAILPPVPLKTLVVAGEACHSGHLREWLHPSSGVFQTAQRFVNAYGPTETAVCALGASFTREELLSLPPEAPLPLGNPLAGVQVRLCDLYGHPLPSRWKSVRGELSIGGKGAVGCHYHRLTHASNKSSSPSSPPSLSASSSSSSSSSSTPTDAQPKILTAANGWFSTGDVMSLESSGFRFHWRRGVELIKIRGGIRTSLAGVECILLQHPSVATGAVIQCDAGGGLVAFVVCHHHHLQTIRQHSQSTISSSSTEPMALIKDPALQRDIRRTVTSATRVSVEVILLSALPLSTNGGKCDRRRLQRMAMELKVKRCHGRPSSASRREMVHDVMNALLEDSSVSFDELMQDEDPQCTLIEWGFSSVDVIELQSKIRSKWNYYISYTSLSTLQLPRLWSGIRRQDDGTSGDGDHQQQINWDEEVRRLQNTFAWSPDDESGHSPPLAASVQPKMQVSRVILVTGGTGLLGSRLIEQLLMDFVGREEGQGLVCAVRADTSKQAQDRVTDQLNGQQAKDLWLRACAAGRVGFVLGDLASDHWTNDAWHSITTRLLPLEAQIIGIIHSAAKMDFNADYHSHRSNLKSLSHLVRLTQRLLTLPRQPQLQTTIFFHHVSTLGVFPFGCGEVTESSVPRAAGMTGGYSQSKWVCETALRQHWTQDQKWNQRVALRISRPGRLVRCHLSSSTPSSSASSATTSSSSSSSPIVSSSSSLTAHDRIMAAVREMGWIDGQLADLPYDLTCVDNTCERMMLWLSDDLRNPLPSLQTRHFIQSSPLSLGQVMGVKIRRSDDELSSHDEWIVELDSRVRQFGASHPAFPLLPFLTGRFWKDAISLGWPKFIQ